MARKAVSVKDKVEESNSNASSFSGIKIILFLVTASMLVITCVVTFDTLVRSISSYKTQGEIVSVTPIQMSAGTTEYLALVRVTFPDGKNEQFPLSQRSNNAEQYVVGNQLKIFALKGKNNTYTLYLDEGIGSWFLSLILGGATIVLGLLTLFLTPSARSRQA